MLSTLKKERHMVTGLKKTEDLVHRLNIYISWSVMEGFFSSKNISQKHQANMSFLWKLLNLFLPDPQGPFWATLDFPESQGPLTFLSVQWVTNLFPSWRYPGGYKKKELICTGTVGLYMYTGVLWDRKTFMNWRKQTTPFCFPKVSCSCTAVCDAWETWAFVEFLPW